MTKKAILVEGAPAAVGPYTHANIIGDLVFVSGQLPMADGELKTDIPEAAKAALDNLKIILEGAGSSLEKCVKVIVYLTDMNDFTAMNEVYGTYFTENEPARSCFAVAGLPKGAVLEIEAIAHL